MKNKSISIIVLTYNSEKFIGRCLESLVNQSFKNFEVIIIDSSSSDRTIDIINSYRFRLDINLIKTPLISMGDARNIGIRASNSKYICFCDSDDFFLPSKLKIQFNLLESNPAIDVVFYDVLHKNEFKNDLYKRYSNDTHVPLIKRLIIKQCININSLLLKRIAKSKIIFFPEKYYGQYAEDWQYLINLLLAGYKFKFIKNSYSIVEERVNSHTSWSIQHHMKFCILNYLKNNKKMILKAGIKPYAYNSFLCIHKLKYLFSCIFIDKFNQNTISYKFDNKAGKIFFFLIVYFLRFKPIKNCIRFLWELKRNFLRFKI